MDNGPYYVVADVRLTRRIYVCQIWSNDGTVAWTANSLAECLAWLKDTGQRHTTVYRAIRSARKFLRIQIEIHDTAEVAASSVKLPWDE